MRVYASGAEAYGNGVRITAKLAISAVFIQRILELDVVWTVHPDGGLSLALDGKRDAALPWLPRFGLRLFVPESFGSSEYFGYGPYESYIDKHRASYLSRFTADVDRLHEDYIKPQENGSHYGCSSLALTDSQRNSICVSGDAFSFNASRYTQEELSNKPHNFELEKAGCTVLCLDYKMSGVGSNSCGPHLLPQYRLEEAAFKWALHLSFRTPSSGAEK